MEFLPDRESTVSGTFMFIDGMVYVISPLIIKYITNNMDLFIEVACVMNVVSLLMFLIIRTPESLKFLLSKNRIKEFWKNFEIVKRLNRIKDED